MPKVESNSLNNVTKAIAAITGFFDGGFNAPSATNCRRAATKFYNTTVNYTIAITQGNDDRELWYATRLL